MGESEVIQIILAIVTLALVNGFAEIVKIDVTAFAKIIVIAAVVILVNVAGKKIVASRLDADVEHEIWRVQRYGLKEGAHIQNSVPIGVILPIFVGVITLGAVNLSTILTYETRALKRRAARRFGPLSFTEMTDYHNALVGAAGIVCVLIAAFVSYWIPGFGGLGIIATSYVFFNMFPIGKLDGAQIFFGSRVLWATLVVITLIFMSYAILLP